MMIDRLDAESIIIQGANGKRWLVEIVTNHEFYEAEPVVEFYDFDQNHGKFGPRGQFVSSYYMSTLANRKRDTGLSLDGGIPNWSVNAGTMNRIVDWVEGWSLWGTND